MKKKILSVLASAMMTMSVAAVIPTENMTANAVSQNVLLGDANADGNVDLADAIEITRYLLGRKNITSYKVTAMDVNQDCVIDFNDIYRVYQIEAGSVSATTAYKQLYSAPNFESRVYYKHDCTNSDSSSYTSYVLNNNTVNMLELDNILSMDSLRGAVTQDTENLSTVEIVSDNGYESGFVISDHVIATAASNIYDKTTGRFSENVTVNVRSGNSNNILVTCNARYLHVPALYSSASSTQERNYNYGLIYVENDLSDYVTEVGVAVDDFRNTSSDVTVSGFDNHVRKYSTGMIINNTSMYCNDDYMMTVSTEIDDGMIGGQGYYELNNRKAAIGIPSTTNAAGNQVQMVRLTPTLLKFYKYNSYLA